jgi:RNA polymerase sigma-70 factor (ECF subfamily)
MHNLETLHNNLRGLLKAYAYHICGSVDEAEDVVQNVFLKFLQTDREKIADPKAYLIKMVINHAINQKKKLNSRNRLYYPGEWLPEPVATDRADEKLIAGEILSYSLMVLLERLNARQRAVFILKEAFDYEHKEISGLLGITPDLSRQLLSRSKKILGTGTGGNLRKSNIPEGFIAKYADIIRSGRTAELEALLTEDITSVSDGGGKAVAALKPVFGKKAVAALLTGLHKKFNTLSEIVEGRINGEPALLYFQGKTLIKCQVLSLVNGRISKIYILRNPDKLKLVKN